MNYKNFKPGELFNEHKAMAMGKKKKKNKLGYSQYKPVQSFGKRPTQPPRRYGKGGSSGLPSPKGTVIKSGSLMPTIGGNPKIPNFKPPRGVQYYPQAMTRTKKRKGKKVKKGKKKGMKCKLKHKHDKSCM